jgi:hypothetical protein
MAQRLRLCQHQRSHMLNTQARTIISVLEQRLIPGRPLQIEKDTIGRYIVTVGARTCRGVSITDALAQLCQALAAPVVLPAEMIPEPMRRGGKVRK